MEQATQMKNKPVNILANMMARTSFGTRYQITPEGYKYRPEYEGVNKELKEYYNYIKFKTYNDIINFKFI